MVYRVEFSAEAETDAAETGEYYDNRITGLSSRFYDDLHDVMLSLISNPFSFHLYTPIPSIRRCNLHIFPYAIYFSIEADKIKVLAVIHQRRSKAYIKRKLK